MPLLHSYKTFVIEEIEQYQTLKSLVEKQIEQVCVENTRFPTRFVIFEAINNAVEHGKLPVKITFNNTECNKLIIKITDNGTGFSVNKKIELIREKGADQLLREMLYEIRGRGIFMIFKMTDDVSYNETGNEVSLTILNS